MGVRLILVSVVAGLGLTLPTAKQMTSLKDSAQSWVNARLAEYDARMPADEKAFIYVADAAPVPESKPEPVASTATEAPTVAPATDTNAVPKTSAAPATITPATPEVLATGIDTPTAPMNLDEIEIVSATPVIDTVSKVEDLDIAFNEAQVQTLTNFAADMMTIVGLEDAMPTIESKPDPVVAVQPPMTDLNETDEVQEGLTYLFQPEPQTVPARAEAEAASAEISALVVGDDLYSGIAFSLNRGSEGLNSLLDAELPHERSAVVQFESPGSGSTLSQAVKLTREAVYAWANLLHAPAVVTISH